MIGRRIINAIETTMNSSSKYCFPRDSVLNKKIPRMKFKENIVISSESRDRKEISGDFRDMKDITELKRSRCTRN
jgi:hypothetical protein